MKKIYESDLIICEPVSVNASHFNTKLKKRIRTKPYKKMIEDCLKQLEDIYLKNDKPYRIEYEFFLKTQGSDVDNFIKCFQDIFEEKIQEKNPDFNDNQFYEIQAKKYFPELKKGGQLGVKFKIFEIKIPKEKDNMILKINKKIGEENYEN